MIAFRLSLRAGLLPAASFPMSRARRDLTASQQAGRIQAACLIELLFAARLAAALSPFDDRLDVFNYKGWHTCILLTYNLIMQRCLGHRFKYSSFKSQK